MTQKGQGGGPADRAVRDQRQEDHAHRLLCIVGAVCQRDQRRREDLAAAESGLAALLRDAAVDPVDQPGADRTDDPGHRHGYQGRDQHAGHHAGPDHPVSTDCGDHRTDDAADQGMRGARRDTQQPGHQVPEDAADQTGEHQLQGHQMTVDQILGDRSGDRR